MTALRAIPGALFFALCLHACWPNGLKGVGELSWGQGGYQRGSLCSKLAYLKTSVEGLVRLGKAYRPAALKPPEEYYSIY